MPNRIGPTVTKCHPPGSQSQAVKNYQQKMQSIKDKRLEEQKKHGLGINKPLAIRAGSAALMLVVLAGLSFAKLDFSTAEKRAAADKPFFAKSEVTDKVKLGRTLMSSFAVYAGVASLIWYMLKPQNQPQHHCLEYYFSRY